MSFYKINNEELIEAPNYVYAPTYTLEKENRNNYTYPIDGWYWFDTLLEAMTALTKEPINNVPQAISKRQGRAQLKAEGLLISVENYMATLPIDDTTRMAYEDASEWLRQDLNVINMLKILDKTSTDADLFFTEAFKL